MTPREEKLTLALRELKGFAERNAKRAEKYVEMTAEHVKQKRTGIEEIDRNTNMQAEARHHEAVRFLLVVRERVKEALAP